jgi:hypothetical protein
MAMSAAHQNFVSATSYRAKILLDQIGPLDQLNVLWAGSPGYDTAITQEEIDSVESFAGAGLTAQNLADAEYVLAGILTSINNALVALTVLANLP